MEGSAILNNVVAVTTPAVAARNVPMTQSGLFVLTCLCTWEPHTTLRGKDSSLQRIVFRSTSKK